MKGLGNQVQVTQANFYFPGFDFGEVVTVHPDPLSHFKLRPAPLLAERPNTVSKLDADVIGHPPIIVCRISPTNRG